MEKVLCLDDDPTIQILVESSLPEYQIVCVSRIEEAKKTLIGQKFSAVILDIQLPDGDGLRFLADLSQGSDFKEIPCLILSDYAQIQNKVMAFSLGAEDFIAKPFDPLELRARVDAKLKKAKNHYLAARRLKVGHLLVDLDRQKAFQLNGHTEQDLGLTGIELKILNLLLKRLENVYSREQILEAAWGETFVSDRTVDSHVAHLRKKISITSVAIETVKNIGYRAVSLSK